MNAIDIFSILWALLTLPMVVFLVYTRLPSRKLGVLLATFNDTEALYAHCVEAGLLNAKAAVGLGTRMKELQSRVNAIRLSVLKTTGIFQDVVSLLRGHSTPLYYLIGEVKALRAEISAVSYRELKQVQLKTVGGKEIAQLHSLVAIAVPVDLGIIAKDRSRIDDDVDV